MRKIRLNALFLAAALAIVAVGSAALSNLSFNRSVSAGEILVDTDENVAIQISNISGYDGLVKTEADGKVSFHLNEAINNNTSNGFNTDAVFTIGSATKGAIKIKNNSDIPVKVSLINDDGSNSLSLAPTGSSSTTIGVGASGEFYFTVNTDNQDAGKALNAVLSVEAE